MNVIDDRIAPQNNNNHQQNHHPLTTKVDDERMTSVIDSSDSDNDSNRSSRSNGDSSEKNNGSTVVVLSSSPNTVAYELASFHINHNNHVFETAATTMPPFLISPTPSPPTATAWPVLQPSMKSLQTHNPIREIVDPIISAASKKASSNHDSSSSTTTISLALGDPTIYGGALRPCRIASDAIIDIVQNNDNLASSYIDACGLPAARQAIANYHQYHPPKTPTTRSTSSTADDDNTDAINADADNVIIANGCSGAIELAITAIMENNYHNNTATKKPRTVLLLPNPGFPLYHVIAQSHGCSYKNKNDNSTNNEICYYQLLSNQNWEIDLVYLRTIIQQYMDQAANGYVQFILIINNPSNPTGAVFTKQHIINILTLCEEFHMPVIADEVYGDIVFTKKEDEHEDRKFHPISHIVTQYGMNVPVITASGLSKQYLLPGWRLGWIIFQDNRYGSLREIKKGAKRLAQLILGASHLIQAVVPRLLQPKTVIDIECIREWKENLIHTLSDQATCLCNALDNIPGLVITMKPCGAMYALVQIDVTIFDNAISSDIDFTKRLLEEENVFVLPGSCFTPRDTDANSNHNATTTNTNNIDHSNTGDEIDNDSSNNKDTAPSSSMYFFRVVFCAPNDVLIEAALRINNFCIRHLKST